MLCLLAHAFFVSVTHHHSSPREFAEEAIVSVTSDDGGGSGATPGTAGDAHCLSCRLQRNFTSNIHPASLVVQLVKQPLSRETTLFRPCSTSSFFILSDRAPPTA